MSWARRARFLGICISVGVFLLFINSELTTSPQLGSSQIALRYKEDERIHDPITSRALPCEASSIVSLRPNIRGQLLCRGDHGFREAVKIFNLRHIGKHIPAVVVQPSDIHGVADALQLAKLFQIPVTVKNGGHNPAGLSRHGGGLLIDMSKMKSIEVNLRDMTVSAEGGALWSDVQAEIKDKHITVVGGGCPSVGVVGLVLGGGIGWLSRTRGLVSDNVLGMEVILGNGTIRAVSEKSYPELFWGLRGAGGSNFGVVTKVKIKAFPAEPVYFAGTLALQADEPIIWMKLMAAWLRAVEDIKDDGATPWMALARTVKYGPRYDGGITTSRFSVPLFYDGPASEGPRAFAPLLHQLADVVHEYPQTVCGDMKAAAICENPFQNVPKPEFVRDWVDKGQPFFQNHSFVSWSQSMGATELFMDWKSGLVEEITPELAQTAAEVISNLTYIQDVDGFGTLHVQYQVEHLGGKISEFPADHSAFKHRSAKLLWSIQILVEPETMPSQHLSEAVERWCAEAFARLKPYFKGSYQNYADLGLDHQDWQHRYYGRHYERLQKLKEDVGGFELFTGRQRIEKAG